MILPPLLILGLAANLISMTIGSALLMLILWQSRQRSNVLFALFLIAMTSVAVCGLVFRFAPVFQYDPTPWLYGFATGNGAYGVLLFIFASEFTGKTTRLARALYAVGGLAMIVGVAMIWSGRVLINIQPTLKGETNFDFTPLGYALMLVLISFEALALVSCLINPTERSRALIPGVVILLAAPIGDAVSPVIAHLPVNSVLTALAAIAMGRMVLKFQLFDPLRRLNQDLAEAYKEMANASELKSQFLANMSHELRTPLNSIIGYSELILDELYGPLTDKQRDRLAKVHRNGKSLLALINDILDLSKIEAGRMELDKSLVNMRQIAENVVAMIQPLAQEKGLDLHADIPTELPLLMADEARLQQIIINLVSNAIKFTTQGSVIIAVGPSADSECMEIKVADTGIGIPPESLDLVFDEFRQVDNTSTREYGGTGLGLAISRRFARLHGGNITAKSTVGEGSTFTVTLPIHKPESTLPAVTTGPLVLTIDDQEEAGDLIREQLMAAGYQVRVARSGKDGLTLAREIKPAAITLDVMMPEMDGWQVLEKLRADPLTANIPVIMVSIVDHDSLALELGARNYVTKPIDSERLLSALNGAIVRPMQHPILIVDDNPNDRDLMSTILSKAGYPVAVVSNGAEAIRWLDNNSAGLVVLDLMMPQVSGFEVLTHIRSHSGNRNLPVLVLTAKTLTDEEQTFLNEQFAEVVRKSGIAKDKLLDEIKRALAPQSDATHH